MSGLIQEVTPMVYIASLAETVTDLDLLACFKKVGEVLWCEVSKDKTTGVSLGDGYVCFSNTADAGRAISIFNSSQLKGRIIYVMPSEFSFNQVLVYLGDKSNMTADELKKRFAQFGTVLHARLYTHPIDEYYGFVTFDSLQAAAKAATALLKQDMAFPGMTYCGKFQVDPKETFDIVTTPSKMKHTLKEKEVQTDIGKEDQKEAETVEGFTILVENINPLIGEFYLTNVFSPYGNVTSCKVKHTPDSHGYGRVSFSTLEEAKHAVAQMNGEYIFSELIWVALEENNGQNKSSQDKEGNDLEVKDQESGPLALPSS